MKYNLYHNDHKYTLFSSDNNDFYFKYDKPKNKPKNKKNVKKIKLYSVFISILVIFFSISILYINFFKNNSNYNNLYYKYYQTTHPDVFRSSTLNNISFDETTLKEIIKNNQNNMVARFYLASLYQENNNCEKAIEQYQIIIKNNDNIFVEESNWNIALCYLKTNQNDKLIKQLKYIKNNKNFYSENSSKILNKIK